MQLDLRKLNNTLRDFLVVQTLLVFTCIFLLAFEIFYLSPKSQLAKLDRYTTTLADQLSLVSMPTQDTLAQFMARDAVEHGVQYIIIEWRGQRWRFDFSAGVTASSPIQTLSDEPGNLESETDFKTQGLLLMQQTGSGQTKPVNKPGRITLYASQQYRYAHLAGYGVALLTVLFSILFTLLLDRKLNAEIYQLHRALDRLGRYLQRDNSDGAISPLRNIVILTSLAREIKQLEQLTRNIPDSLPLVGSDQRALERKLSDSKIENIELSLAKQSAIEANQVKSQILANTGHELLTPLNSIVGFSKLLLEEKLDRYQYRNFLNRINDNALHLTALVNDLLDVSVKSGQSVSLNYQPTDIYSLLFSIANIIAHEAQGKGLNLLTNFDSLKGCEFDVDPLRLRQVVSNLAINAIRYTESGHVEINADVIDDRDGLSVLSIQVSDTGIGIDEEKQKSIFSAFVTDSARAAQDGNNPGLGLGLGLAIVSRLLHKMGGRLALSSEIGVGSQFSVELPIRNTPALAAQSIAPADSLLIVSEDAAAIDHLKIRAADYARSITVTDFRLSTVGTPASVSIVLIDQNRLEELNRETGPLYQWLNSASESIVLHLPLASRLDSASLRQRDNIRQLSGPFHISELFGSADSAPEQPLPDPVQAGNDSTILKGKRALVVDDNAANIELFALLLESLGCNVETADNGERALQIAQNHDFDWLFLDIRMQPMDGITLLARLRMQEKLRQQEKLREQETRSESSPYRNTPAIACTAHTSKEEYRKLTNAGFDKIIYKPVNQQMIVQLANHFFAASSAVADTPASEQTANSDNATPDIEQQPMPTFDIQYSLDRAAGKPTIARRIYVMFSEELKQFKHDGPPTAIETMANSYDTIDRIHQLNGGAAMTGARALKQQLNQCEGLLKSIATAADPQAMEQEVDAQLRAVYQEIDTLLAWEADNDLDIIFAAD